MKKYKVWAPTPKYFTDIDAAIKYAEYFRMKTGDIIAITEFVARKKGDET